MTDENPPYSLAGLGTSASQTQQKVEVSVWGYIILSLVFPPFTTFWAFYKANKKHVLHIVLPAITIAFSVAIGFSAISSRTSIDVPDQIAKLGVGEQIGVSNSKLIFFDNVTLMAALVGLFAGIYWKFKVNKDGALSGFGSLFMISIVILQMVSVSYLFYYVYQTAYGTLAPLINSDLRGLN